MKKLIFGLILSVGVSGMGIANDTVLDTFAATGSNDQQNVSESSIENVVVNSVRFSTCYVADHYTAIGCDGESHSFAGPLQATSCGDGEAAGTVTIRVHRQALMEVGC